MSTKLRNDIHIWRLAADLKLPKSDNPVAEILAFCRKRIRGIIKEFNCRTLADLLRATAGHVDLHFVEIHTDDELQRVKSDYVSRGEFSLADLEDQLAPNVYAITFKRLNATPGERRYLGVIDCRGDKKARSYFSKWHEIAHLLTLTQQARLQFRRTHVEEVKDPEEALMDVIAGDLAYLPALVGTRLQGPPTFEQIESLRQELCPASSKHAWLLGAIRNWPAPCLLLRCELGLKASERTQQTFLSFVEPPTQALRAVRVTSSVAARDAGFSIPRNMRVPSRSLISSIFEGRGPRLADAREDLGWWEASAKGPLASRAVLVHARKYGDGVDALVVPA